MGFFKQYPLLEGMVKPKRHDLLTGRYMQLASAPRESSGQNERPSRRCRPPRLPPGTPWWRHGFCQRENNQNNIISPHRTTSAKTRATATLRQHAHTAERYSQCGVKT